MGDIVQPTIRKYRQILRIFNKSENKEKKIASGATLRFGFPVFPPESAGFRFLCFHSIKNW